MSENLPTAPRRGSITNYDPERQLKKIAVAGAAERHYMRGAKSKNPLVAAKNREKLYEAIDEKITAQAEYVVDRDSRISQGQRTDLLPGGNKLPDADPGKIIAHRWRRSYCIQTEDDEGKVITVIEPTLLAEAIRDAQEKCIRAVRRRTRQYQTIKRTA